MTESQNSSQISVERKRVNRTFQSWKFLDTIQAEVLACEFEERKRKLIEHFRTRTTHDQPICVWSVTIFADLKPLVLAQASENSTVSIAIIGYVQTNPSSQFTMIKWIPSATGPRRIVQQWLFPGGPSSTKASNNAIFSHYPFFPPPDPAPTTV